MSRTSVIITLTIPLLHVSVQGDLQIGSGMVFCCPEFWAAGTLPVGVHGICQLEDLPRSQVCQALQHSGNQDRGKLAFSVASALLKAVEWRIKSPL